MTQQQQQSQQLQLAPHFKDPFSNVVIDTKDLPSVDPVLLSGSLSAFADRKYNFCWMVCRGDDRPRMGAAVGYALTVAGTDRKSVRAHKLKRLERFDPTTGAYDSKNKVDLAVLDNDWLMCIPLTGSKRTPPEAPETATGVSGFVLVIRNGQNYWLVCSDDKFRHVVSYRRETAAATSAPSDLSDGKERKAGDDKKAPTEVSLAGGGVGHGETIEEAWMREVREEIRVQHSKRSGDGKTTGLELVADSVQVLCFTSYAAGNRYGCRGEFYTMFAKAEFHDGLIQGDGDEVEWVALATDSELCNTTQWTKRPAPLRLRMARQFEAASPFPAGARFWGTKAEEVRREIEAEAQRLQQQASRESDGRKRASLEKRADDLLRDRVRTISKKKEGEPNEMIYVCC